MQEQHIDDLKNSLVSELFRKPNEQQKSKVEKALETLQSENKLLALPPDEFQLLMDFRLWKQSSDAATGVFHWDNRPSAAWREPKE